MDTNLVPSANHKQIKVKSQNSAEGHNKLLHEESNARIPSAKRGVVDVARNDNVILSNVPSTAHVDGPTYDNLEQTINENSFANFIRDRDIIVRYCKKYVPDYKKSDGRCQCGRKKVWHEQEGIPITAGDSNEKWQANDAYTSRRLCDAFGVIEFRGFGQDVTRRVPYIRVDTETSPADLRDLLSDQWNIPSPRLIISVTGGAKSFYMKTRLKNSFKRGLINAATSTGAWIITGGTSTGVMEFVGEAVKDFQLQSGSTEQQVVALGIATWGIVDNKQSLICYEEKGNFPAYYNIDDLQTGKAAGAPLDHNHTHFILVDNGTENKFGVEIKLRAAIEQHISDVVQTGVSENQSVHVPVVLLVLEGGENTMATAAEAINKGTPVVIIQGSGRCADLIAEAYSNTKNKENPDESNYPSNFDEEVAQQATTTFDWMSIIEDGGVRQEKARKCVKDMRTILDNRRLLTVFQLDQTSDATNEIDQAILYALMKANKSDVQTQLNLALAWNRSDMARKEIFNVENRAAWQSLDLDTAMFEALVQDRADFVQLFVDSGVNFKKFLTVRRLRDLYDKVINSNYHDASTDLINDLIDEVEHKWYIPDVFASRHTTGPRSNQLHIIGCVVNYLISDQQENMYAGNKFKVMVEENNSMMTTVADLTQSNVEKSSQVNLAGLTKKQGFVPDFPDSPEKELFVWAILFNRRELAKLFWRLSKDHIGGALMASALLKALAEEADREEEVDLSQDLGTHAQDWEDTAVGVLNECYQKDKVTAHSLLTRQIRTWGGTTLFSIADSAMCMDFMGHSCCQTKLNRIWKGRMALYTSMWKILLNLVFFWILLPLIKFSPGEQKETRWGTENGEQTANVKTLDNQVTPSDKEQIDGGLDHEGTFTKSKTKKPRQSTRKLYSVKLFPCGPSKNTISMWKGIYYFHTAPVVKFCYHTLSYLVFLGLFSFFLMTDLKPVENGDNPSTYEYIVWVWAGSMFIEEIRQMLTTTPRSVSYKLASYFSSLWNVFDVVVIVFMIISIILRYSLGASDFNWARRVYAITLVLYYLRFLYIFYVSKNIGPKVIMIRRMITDLLFFLVILVVVIFAYGVASQTLRYPNDTVEWTLIKDVVYLPYWQMYGELMLEQVEGEVTSCSTNATVYENTGIDRCPEESWLALILFAIYMIFTNVLLLSLLIAMFSYTFERVQENSEKVWRFFRYDLIFEYFDRPALAAPLIIFTHIFRMFVYLRGKAVGIKTESDFEQLLDVNEDAKLTAFEKAGIENYLHRNLIIAKNQIDVKVAATGERIEKIIEDLDRVREQTESSGLEGPSVVPAVPGKTSNAALHNRIVQLEKKVEQQTTLMTQQSNQLNKVLALLERRS